MNYKNKILALIKKNIWPLLLVVVVFFISISNFQSDRWLNGWDTLHPEFNFQLHFYRSIFGVWREDQGLGALAAHSHMSELPRIFIFWLLSIIFPINIIRALFIFICFILGPLGIFYFSKKVIFKEESYKTNVASFLAALVYIFNLGTVQHFYVVFEMFAVQYAVLGWLFIYIHNALYENNRRNLIILFLISFFSAPMAYASQLWFALFGALILYMGTLYIFEKEKKFILKNILQILLIFISANSFWLLPNLYFLTSGASKIPMESHINRIFSQESFLFNAAFGGIKDVAILRNFLFDWSSYNFKEARFEQLLGAWNKHLQNPLTFIIGYLVFFFSVIGIIKGFVKKEKELLALFVVFSMSIFVLMNSNYPFEWLFNFFRENISIFREGLRTPFTKFSLLTMFTISIFFGVAVNWVLNKYTSLALYSITISLFFYGFPMFQGELIGKIVYNQIPNEYFEFFKWSNKQPPNSRIALMPVNNFVGWEYNNWGYQGAGFIWFGINQPFLTRDFDRWSPYNETFYNEISTAVYGNDVKHFDRVLKKYSVSFILLDESKIEPNSKNSEINRNREIKIFLNNLGIKELWKKNFLSVYDVRSLSKSYTNLQTPESYSKIISNNTYTRRDELYEEFPSYFEVKDESVIYPFADLSKTYIKDLIFQNDNILIKKPVYENVVNYSLVVPPIVNSSTYKTNVNLKYIGNKVDLIFEQNPTLYVGNQNIKTEQLPNISFDTNLPFEKIGIIIGDTQVELKNGENKKFDVKLEVKKPLVVQYYDFSKIIRRPEGNIIPRQEILSRVYSEVIWNNLVRERRYKVLEDIESLTLNVSTNSQILDIRKSSNCNEKPYTESIKKIEKDYILFESKNKDFICEGIDLSNISQNDSYLLRWKYLNENGRTFKFFLSNQSSERIDLEELLPEKENEAVYSIISWPLLRNEGYKLTFENRSLGQLSSNQLNSIEVHRYPNEFVKKIKLVPQNYQSPTLSNVVISKISKFGTHYYSANVKSKTNDGLITLDQSFDKGWIGLRYKGIEFIEFLEHGKYNGWSNGWRLPVGEYSVIIFYWPQYLSYLGFILGIIVFIRLLRNFARLK